MKRVRGGVEYLSALVLLVVCCGGELYGVLPFGTPMYCALTAFALHAQGGARQVRSEGAFLGFTSPIYVALSYLFTFDVWRLYLAGVAVFFMAVRWFLSLKLAGADRYAAWLLFSLCAIMTQTALYALFVSAASALICGLISAVYLYFARRTAVCAMRRFAFRLSVQEAASVCVTLAVAGLTFGRAEYGGVSAGLGLAYFCALMLCAVGVKAALAGSISMALGLALGDVRTAFAFCVCAAVAVVFATLPRPLYAAAGAVAFAAFCALFGAPGVALWNALSALAGGVLYCILPRRAVRAISAYFDFEGSERLAVRHYINRVKADAGNRMLRLSSVFDETARLMSAFSPPPPDLEACGRALADRVCPYCAKAGECDKERASAAFTALAERAKAGKAVLTELPEFFTSDCARTAEVISAAGAMSDGARERLKRTEGEEKARGIVAERLAAIKDVLAELGTTEARPVGFDGDAERRVRQELAACGIECAEAFVTKDGVTAIVRTASADRERIRRAVSACVKRNCEVTALERTQAAGWSVATLKRRPAYEAVYARAGVSKSGGVSGDSYAFERIGDRFLVALLDGMGAGERAGEGSGAAIELIESFYRAGFDSESALSGVNRFLKLPGGESFSAADVAVCDLDSAAVDIIKIGAPPCYIKTEDTVLKVEGSSLPIGVLDEMRPYVTTKRLYPGQMLILVTDGVSDCFSGDELPEYINGLTAYNPERAVEAILKRALRAVGDVPRDDMTAVAFRLIDAPKKERLTRR